MRRYKKTLVVVSHDRGFLNEVTTDIIHLHDEGLYYYRGNFANFEEMYEQRRKAMNKDFDKFQKQMRAATITGNKEKQKIQSVKIERNQQKAQDKRTGGGKKNKGFMEDTEDDAASAKPRKYAPDSPFYLHCSCLSDGLTSCRSLVVYCARQEGEDAASASASGSCAPFWPLCKLLAEPSGINP